MRVQSVFSRLGAGVFAMMLALPVVAQRDGDGFIDRSPDTCISPSSIREIEIIDDQTILFYMRGRRVYRNILDRSCRGLDDRSRIRYDVRGGRLCSSDTITVLQLFGGIDPGVICFLGEFHPITREEAELIEMESIEPGSGAGSVVMTPLPDPELEDGDSEDGDSEDGDRVDAGPEEDER